MTLEQALKLPPAPPIDWKVAADITKQCMQENGAIGGIALARSMIEEHFGTDTEFFPNGAKLVIALVREKLRIELTFY